MTAQTGPAVIIAHVEDSTGPQTDVPVVFYWPDAPLIPEWAWGCGLGRGVIGYTNLNGDVGFGLGTGSYYWPPEVGPHCLWLGLGTSECVCGLGMVALTEHDHLNPGYFLLLEGMTPEKIQDPLFLVEGTVTMPIQTDAGPITVYILEQYLDSWLDLMEN